MKTSIYLLMGGTPKTGIWFSPQHFNYKKSALKFLRALPKSSYKLKIVKFTSEEI